MNISYTFPSDCAIQALRDKTLSGGELTWVPGAGEKMTFGAYTTGNAVVFTTTVHPSGQLIVKLAGRPDLQAIVKTAVEAEETERRAKAAAAREALEAAVPGIHEIMDLADAADFEIDRWYADFGAMMDDGNNDGARPPRAMDTGHATRLETLLAANPRAALYLKAKKQAERAHWADNTGHGAAGKKAMTLLEQGASVTDASAALAERRHFVD